MTEIKPISHPKVAGDIPSLRNFEAPEDPASDMRDCSNSLPEKPHENFPVKTPVSVSAEAFGGFSR